MQLKASNTSSLNDFANFCWIRIDENAHSADSLRQRIHNSPDESRLNVARARRIKVKPDHVCAELDARLSIVRVCNTADFDLDRRHFTKFTMSEICRAFL